VAEPLDFTIRSIGALKAPETGRDEWKDAKVAGLYLRVTANGVKTFSFVGRAKGSSRVERVTLGKFPAVKPEQARTRALTIAGNLASGTSVATMARERRGELTLNDLKEEYSRRLRRETRRPETFDLLYRLYIAPHFGTQRLSEIRATDVSRWFHALPEQILRNREEAVTKRRTRADARRKAIAARQAIRRHGPDPAPRPATPPVPANITGKTSANRAIRALRAMFNWAMKPQQAYFAGANPAADHKQFKEVERERFLQPHELRPFFDALAAEPNTTIRDSILIKLLTGARRENVYEMRWSDVNLQQAVWHIPETKNGDAQDVPLVEEAISLLRGRKKGASSVFVFPSDSSESGHITSTTKAWRRVLARSGLTNLVQHDLRRTLGSWQARTGASLVLIGKSLNHRDTSSTQIYARLDMDPVRQSVARATSAMLEAAGIKPAGELVSIPLRAKATKKAKRA
jgi:integrase